VHFQYEDQQLAALRPGTPVLPAGFRPLK
jgi:hypothetical protein